MARKLRRRIKFEEACGRLGVSEEQMKLLINEGHIIPRHGKHKGNWSFSMVAIRQCKHKFGYFMRVPALDLPSNWWDTPEHRQQVSEYQQQIKAALRECDFAVKEFWSNRIHERQRLIAMESLLNQARLMQIQLDRAMKEASDAIEAGKVVLMTGHDLEKLKDSLFGPDYVQREIDRRKGEVGKRKLTKYREKLKAVRHLIRNRYPSEEEVERVAQAVQKGDHIPERVGL